MEKEVVDLNSRRTLAGFGSGSETGDARTGTG